MISNSITFGRTLQYIQFDYRLFERLYSTFLLSQKLHVENTFERLTLKQVCLIFKINFASSLFLETFIAMFFFLRLLTNQKPYFYPIKVIAGFKKKAYNCICAVNLKKQNNVLFLMGFMSRVSDLLSVNDLYMDRNFLDRNFCAFSIVNFSFLRFVETHPIFFKWKVKLDIILAFQASNKNVNLIGFQQFCSVFKINENLFR